MKALKKQGRLPIYKALAFKKTGGCTMISGNDLIFAVLLTIGGAILIVQGCYYELY